MNNSSRTCLFLLLAGALVSGAGCVSQKKYQELETANMELKMEAARADSLENVSRRLAEEIREVETLYRNSLHNKEQMRSANKSLLSNYQNLLERYDALIEQRKNVLSTSSYEKQSLLEQLSIQQEQLDSKERYLRKLEWDLAQKEERLNRMGNQELMTDLESQQRLIQELQAQLQQKENNLNLLRQKISQTMYGLSSDDFTVTEKRGKLYLSMSQNLLFSSGSTNLDAKGKQALQQLANALKNNPGIDITVEGHTDTDGSTAQNWELSVQRAIAVVEALTNYGVDPYRITAAGRSYFDPVATNATASGKALNRRTELIISPQLDELMDLMNQ